MAGSDTVEVIVSPESPQPRREPKRRSRLIAEYRKRKGDPALGGSTRVPLMTAYRQHGPALRLGPERVAAAAARSGRCRARGPKDPAA